MGKQAFGVISSIETPDAHTVVLKFSKLWSPTRHYLSVWFAGIMPKHLYEGTDILKNEYNLKPVGSGPFMFQEYKKGQYITLVKNPNYWRAGKPYLDKITLRIIRDGAVRVLSLEKGEVDVLPPYMMPVSEMQRLNKAGVRAEAFFTPAGTTTMFMMNLENKYLSGKKVRHALAHAIDRQKILDMAYFGAGKVAVSPIPTSVPWAFNDQLPKFEYNPHKANQMLDAAGYKRGSDGNRFSLDLVYQSGPSDFDRASRMLVLFLKEVGVEVKLRALERVVVQEEVYKKKNFDLHYESLTMGPDPAVGAARIYLTSQIRATHGVTNSMSYSNAEVDRLFDEGGRSKSLEAAGLIYKKIQSIILDDMPCLYVIERPYVMAFSANLLGLPAGPFWTEHMESVGWKK